ncbi:hypothetical protein IAQ61_012041 [Plenodomus lingam]|uniref:Similar to short-chain dehydrogenase/reductase SDR n=1 Tax=Leptosphaeria maculans (strain JN3 / isolate v23.1.3 / race Av1-4-5-6-7-8) TaxID=985895 RepID=E5ABX3_LEPMJ|nr:similar to short-chain dehydrogenase/reductase SDR [Plenodomus lingam JN3]KAH9860256.1 hypothetical protein IAQ61_012041 [Plenodomus lingam]CBY01164.1 similar to short-chain dehydrogenase/reductase SDR [Plenodomus lingam JN3]
MARTLILFGAGPGIGNNVALAFAASGITHIILLSRNTQRLETSDAPLLRTSYPSLKISTLHCDLADLAALPSVLESLSRLTSAADVEVVFFNAARIKPTQDVFGVSVEEMEEDFKTTNLALFLVARHYLPVLTDNAVAAAAAKEKGEGSERRPALLVTNSALPWDPVPQLLSLSLVKAAQKNMVESFARAWEGKGVHIGLVFVEGTVAPENKVLNPKTIAERTVAFWKEGKGLGINIKEE